MSTGLRNKLAKQIGEHLVCAELGRRGLIATPFSGNVPDFDIVAADESCRTLPIQVKASRSSKWPSNARLWLDLSFDSATKTQRNLGLREITNPDLVYICVAISPPEVQNDRFFILTKRQLQEICVRCYLAWMQKHAWKRPVNPESYDCRYEIADLLPHENDWQIITDRLAKVEARHE